MNKTNHLHKELLGILSLFISTLVFSNNLYADQIDNEISSQCLKIANAASISARGGNSNMNVIRQLRATCEEGLGNVRQGNSSEQEKEFFIRATGDIAKKIMINSDIHLSDNAEIGMAKTAIRVLVKSLSETYEQNIQGLLNSQAVIIASGEIVNYMMTRPKSRVHHARTESDNVADYASRSLKAALIGFKALNNTQIFRFQREVIVEKTELITIAFFKKADFDTRTEIKGWYENRLRETVQSIVDTIEEQALKVVDTDDIIPRINNGMQGILFHITTLPTFRGTNRDFPSSKSRLVSIIKGQIP